MADDFSNDALVLIAHGSTVNAQSSAPTRRLVEELRARQLFAEVACAFNLEQPKIDDVPKLVSAKRIFIVPVTISEGHFTEQTIPHRLGLAAAGELEYERIQQRDRRTLIYCHPIGTHASMTDVLLARARAIVEQHPFPRAPKPAETALFIAGHGTEKLKIKIGIVRYNAVRCISPSWCGVSVPLLQEVFSSLARLIR